MSRRRYEAYGGFRIVRDRERETTIEQRIIMVIQPN